MAELVTYRPLIAAVAGVAGLLVLILWARMNAFAALILVALASALAAGLGPDQAYATVIDGMGGTLGFIAVVIGLGALFGAIVEASGGLTALADRVLSRGSPSSAGWVTGLVGLLAAIPVFFDVALIVLAPLVFAMARKGGRPVMVFALPLLVGLAVGHATIPPTPGPIAVTEILGADLGWVILFGLIAGPLATIVAGPIFVGMLDRRGLVPAGTATRDEDEQAATAPPVLSAASTAALVLLPLVLILVGTLARTLMPEGEGGWLRQTLLLIGHPFAALLIGCGLAAVAFRHAPTERRDRLRASLSKALEPTGAVLLVTGAGGAFKQVLVDTGAGSQIAVATAAIGLTPIVAGFVLALLIRVAQGSATVAMITGAGLVAPIAAAASLSGPELALVVLAVAAGASALSHVNDSGFWLVSKLFGLTEAETLRTWTVAVSLASLTIFAVVLLLDFVV